LATNFGNFLSQHFGNLGSLVPKYAEYRTNSQSRQSVETVPLRVRILRASQSTGTESVHLGLVELVDVGDDTSNFTEFLRQQAKAANDNHQACMLMSTLPRCPSCTAIAYALRRTALNRQLGATRIVRLDLREFEDELRRRNLPIGRLPGFFLVGRDGDILDFMDAGEWNTNDPEEFGPIIGEFVRGHFKNRRHRWVPYPESRTIDL
jgi:hypothetical protein